MSWEGWNPQDTFTERDDGMRLHDVYESMEEMTVLAWREADAKTATFKRWFAESVADNVKNVLGRIIDMTLPVPEAQPRLTSRVLDRTDFGNGCKITGTKLTRTPLDLPGDITSVLMDSKSRN
jgi:hypothetical protein